MSVITLVLFMLMLAELFTFALLNINISSTAQSAGVAVVTNDYGTALKQSAGSFAKESLSRAIVVLANYESAPNLRKANFISNTSLYLTWLVVNGTLPNDTSGYPQNAMGNLTFAGYNAFVGNFLGFAAQVTSINESVPRIYQPDPYHIGISYIERLGINSSGSSYKYSIPVNVSLPLNSTPDLFYAQRGTNIPIKFAGINNATILVANARASSNTVPGNILQYAYGTIFNVPSSASSGATCPIAVPTGFSTAPLNKTLIVSTYNGINLGPASCIDKFAGLITYITNTIPPGNVPWLQYALASNIIANLPTGAKVLLYGPGLDTLNIEGLRSAIINGKFFASPFTPSYLDRGQADFAKQSPNGIFAFTNYNQQAGNFLGAGSNVLTANVLIPYASTAFSESVWVNFNSLPGLMEIAGEGIGSCGAGSAYCLNYATTTNIVFGNAGCGSISTGTAFTPSVNTWYNIVATFNANGNNFIYVNGKQYASGTFTLCNFAVNFQIGADGNSDFFKGSMSNLQVYNTSIAGIQVQKLYQEGIGGVPLSNNALVGWWPLNGDTNDYSGYSHNGGYSNVGNNLVPNYQRDSALVYNAPTALSPLPGILSCQLSNACASGTNTVLYLGYMPLEIQNSYLQTAGFNTIAPSVISIPSTANTNIESLTACMWFNTKTAAAAQQALAEKWTGSGAFPYALRITAAGQPSFWAYDGTITAVVNTITAYNDGNWHLACGERVKSSTLKIFVDNNAPSSNTDTTVAATTDASAICLGARCSTLAIPFAGSEANLQIYSSALSPGQVNTIYSEGIAGTPVAVNSMVGWWPLDGNANDYSGNGDTGTATNVIYPYFSGNYNAPGLSSVPTIANEWQAFGLANT